MAARAYPPPPSARQYHFYKARKLIEITKFTDRSIVNVRMIQHSCKQCITSLRFKVIVKQTDLGRVWHRKDLLTISSENKKSLLISEKRSTIFNFGHKNRLCEKISVNSKTVIKMLLSERLYSAAQIFLQYTMDTVICQGSLDISLLEWSAAEWNQADIQRLS